jgi:hypothetical protein
MIKMQTKTVREAPEEMTVHPDDVKFIKYLPTCPKCKLINDVIIFNVTQKIYECGKCNVRFGIGKKME